MSERYVFMDGYFIKESAANVSIYDAAITVGDMVTEVARTFNHHFFYLEDHVNRFLDGLEQLQFKLEISKDEIIQRTHDLFKMNSCMESPDVDWQVVFIFTKGMDTHFSLFPNDKKSTFAILCFPLKNRIGRMLDKYMNGCTVLAADQKAIPHRLLPPQIKSRGRLHLKLAKLQVTARNPKADALLLDEDNNITELSGANLFLVKDGAIYTAPCSLVVSGITRQYIIYLAGELGIDVHEEKIPLTQIYSYDEAFITSTIIGIIHVRTIENHMFGDGSAGPITRNIRDCFMEKVNCDFISEAIRYSTMYTQ